MLLLDAFKAGASAISAGSLFYWVGESIISLKSYLEKSNFGKNEVMIKYCKECLFPKYYFRPVF